MIIQLLLFLQIKILEMSFIFQKPLILIWF